MYLLDTDVLSALRRRDKNVAVANWAASIAAHDLHISVATINEVQQGIERRRKVDPDHAARLSSWIEIVIGEYGSRILPITTPIARNWARISTAIGHDDFDFAIAATALEHDFVVATRNVRDFIKTGARIFDPFERRLHGPE